MGKRPFYADYINHCLRFYCRNTEKPAYFKTKVDEANWLSCDVILNNCSTDERDILISIYCENDTLADNVYQVSKRLHVSQDKAWDIIDDVTRKIAKHRGLL